MGPRLVILILLGAGLAIFLAVRSPAPPAVITVDDGELSQDDIARIRETQELIEDFPLPGETPPELPVITIRHEVRQGEGKNRIYYYLDEAHGYYVEKPLIEFYHKQSPDASQDDSAVWAEIPINNYIKANETFTGCADFTDNELRDIGGDMGTTDNWGAVIVKYGRYRATNPARLIERDDTGRCLD